MEKYYREKNPDFRFSWLKLGPFPAHLHSELELMYIRQGSITAYRNAEVYTLTSGCLFLVSPNQVHAFTDSSSDCAGQTLIMKPGLLSSFGDTLSGVIPALPVCRVEENNAIIKLLDMAFAEFSSHRNMEIILPMLSAMFGILIRTLDFTRETVDTKKSLYAILQYCAQHYREDINIDSISKALFLSRSHISHTFSNKLKVSFTEYINSLRLSEALRLLEDKSVPISQVAELSGFPTVRTFNRVFLKRYGNTPSQYRKQ